MENGIDLSGIYFTYEKQLYGDKFLDAGLVAKVETIGAIYGLTTTHNAEFVRIEGSVDDPAQAVIAIQKIRELLGVA